MWSQALTKITVLTHRHAPDTGGIETFNAQLIEGLEQSGFRVQTFVRQKPQTEIEDQLSKAKVSYPSFIQLLLQCMDSHLIILSPFELRWALIPLILSKKTISIIHTWLPRVKSDFDFKNKVRLYLLQKTTRVTVSNALANSLPGNIKVIHTGVKLVNSQKFEFFENQNPILFVGRLVGDKGVSTLIDAISILRLSNPKLDLRTSIIGSGTELKNLKELVERKGLQDLISFLGTLNSTQVHEKMRGSKLLVVPSIWQEPFGLVAVEGLMNQCRPILAKVGGLHETSLGLELSFEPGNSIDLANSIELGLGSYVDWLNSTDWPGVRQQLDFSNTLGEYLAIVKSLI